MYSNRVLVVRNKESGLFNWKLYQILINTNQQYLHIYILSHEYNYILLGS